MPVKYPYTFTYSDDVENFFIENNIFLKHAFKISNVYKKGDTITLRSQVMIEPFSTMAGKNSFASCGSFSFFQSKLNSTTKIGRYCSISWNVSVMAGDHPISHVSTHLFTYRNYFEQRIRQDFGDAPKIAKFKVDRGPVVIGNDVWIGQNVLLRNGITIGHGAVVAGGSVVVKDVPPYTIVGGNPAKFIRFRFEEKIIEKLLASEWWQYHCKDFAGLDVADPEAFIDGLMERVSKDEISPYIPRKLDLAEEIDKIIIPE